MITDRLHALAASQPERPFLVYADTEFSYADMSGMVCAYARRLRDAGVTRASHVALLCGNRPAFLVAWFALCEIGAVTIPLNTSLVGEGLRYTLRQSRAMLLLAEPALLRDKQADLQAMETPMPTLEIDDAMEAPAAGAIDRMALTPPPGPLDANSILYTSGTTGLPKGAVLPHQSYLSAGVDMAQSLGLTREDRIMVFLPLFHANPQMYAVASALATGAALVLLPRFSASRFFDDAQRYRATGFTFVGTVLSILEKQHPEPRDRGTLAWGVGGGAPLRVWRALQDRFGLRIHELYGMTETGGWVSMNTCDHHRIGSVGHARQGVSLVVRDPQGVPVPVGDKGEITAACAVPGMFFSEYWQNPDSTAATLKDGWLHTGDRGWLDADGFLYFDGRVKELIRRAGEMIAPAEIEQQLLKHDAVRDCAVVGVPDDILGEDIKVFVVAAHDVQADALQTFLHGRVPAYMVPGLFAFVDAIPKTETQKIKRHELAGLQASVVDLRGAA